MDGVNPFENEIPFEMGKLILFPSPPMADYYLYLVSTDGRPIVGEKTHDNMLELCREEGHRASSGRVSHPPRLTPPAVGIIYE